MIPFLLIANLITFGVFGFDKWQAKKQQWRISENTLLGLSLIGALGAASGMILFNHKVSKKSFLVKFIIVVLIDLVLLYRLIRH
ncbi:DUF1294 domain-containing protein [Chryseobacterium arthrosphaerae]|uniref:DUF1294 domain-containing protein n=1 Tax=Chryseobacterium arthrosphaerae TaxID=651561 RepID=A0A1B8ZRK2_9FLAO|nr:DUF1294 domain-containing protein [Chryseobacterium arthrosphaerae]AYZ12423.1 DUF1294 domain-containing protein [Chryseobacterium arthrosphaerae]OCA74209.1 hypothetical protein BBI00_07590 [Chryseobacterium arthrosphaerae]RTZ46421.1 DUF1294 domain-containing protein [Chryseobacterium arthrosphaerae]WES99250.1 DUF1294 domain-containing protein [Chryseobacterium arthrosphaerae]